jgi:hypothetical protein
MLPYAAVNSARYFTQKREWSMVGVFPVILAIGLIGLAHVV